MAEMLVIGGGVCGLAAATLLARDGHDVTVLERDPEPPPATVDEAWERWERGGVVQFRQAHFLHARARHVLEEVLPDVFDRLVATGAVRSDPLDRLPEAIGDRARRPGDEQLATVTARRSTIELAVSTVAEQEPRVTVRRGTEVAGLLTRPREGVPHVTGVRTGSGEEIGADLVVDASGRGSRLPRWLAEAGAAVHEESEDSGFIYYTRYFRARNGGLPEPRAPGLVMPIGTFSLLTLPYEDSVWSVTIFISSGDRPLKRFREAACWTAAVAACPLHAHWLDGEPITDVLPIGGAVDRRRRLVVDGRPVVTGVVLVADSWACTNPSLGRGIALGLLHASRLRDVVRDRLEDPGELAEAWDEVTERELTPWYRATVDVDRARLAEIEALRTGSEVPPPADPAADLRRRLPVASMRDADVFRAFQEIVGVLTLPSEVMARPGFAERVFEVTEPFEPSAPPGPTRAQLLELVA